MSFPQILLLLGLGAFWGASTPLYRLMGDAHVPITHIIFLIGSGVGIGLALICIATGRRFLDPRLVSYGLGCGILSNLPSALSLFFARNLPVSIYATVISTSPFWTYGLSLILARTAPRPLRLLALLAGFAASAILIATQSAGGGDARPWLVAASFVVPMIWAGYNNYTSVAWPEGADPLAAGIAESFASALIVLPVLLWLEPPGATATINWGYWTVAAATLAWVIERIAFFTLIRTVGPVSTVQAVYISTPGGVLFGMLFFGERADVYLWISVALIMLALWFNNRATSEEMAARRPAET
jgi:drug/metabolite transporter (DMT)-like permease